MTPPFFKAKNISKTIRGVPVLKQVSIEANAGELKALVGPSGSGKSTFLQCLNYIITPDSGELFLNGEKVDVSTQQSLCLLRRNIGMIFQDFNLFEHLTAEKNVSIALQKVAGYSPKEARQRALIELRRVGLESKAQAYPAQLSGGQKQRVAIARALAMDPKALLLDEPTSALDPELVGEVLEVIQGLAKSGMTMIMATHQIEFARALASEILFIESGKIAEQGKPDDLLGKGVDSRTNRFYNKLTSYLNLTKTPTPRQPLTDILAADVSHDVIGDGASSALLNLRDSKDDS